MSAYDFNVNEFGKQLLPPVLRRLVQLEWLSVLLKPVQWARDKFFDVYCDNPAFLWSPAATYSIDDVCYYNNKRTYICIANGGFGFNYAPVGGIYSSAKWAEISAYKVGVNERATFSGQIIVLMNAINRNFKNSGTYTYFDSITNIIYMPLSDFNALGSTNPERESAVRNFVDPIRPAGLVYTIVTY